MRRKGKNKLKENFKNIYYKLKMNFHNGNVMKVLFICSAIIILYNCLDITAHASGILDYGNGKSPFEGVKEGWGQFMSEKFRNNYALDAGDAGTFDISKILNAIANLVFNMVVTIAWLTVNIFNLCFSSNIPDQFSSILNRVSSAFQNGVFNKFFMIMFMISTIMLVINYAKRNYAAIFSQLMATVVIIASVAIISSTGARNFVVDTTDFARDIGASLITSINGTDKNNSDGFSEDGSPTSEMLGTMWANLVQKPWVILEFNGTQQLEDSSGVANEKAVKLSDQILSKSTDDDVREKLAKDNIKNVSFASRAGTTIVLALITIIKCFVIMVLGVLQVFFQILAIGIVLIAPLMFLLAVVPFFGGMNLIKWLGKKYLGVQFGIVLLSFAIAMLILVDNILLTFFMSVGASFIVALLIQCLCWVLVIVFRRQIMDTLKSLQEKVVAGSGSPLKIGDKLLDKGAGVGKGAVEPIRRKAVDFKDLAGANARYAKTYMKGKAKIYKDKKMADIIDKAKNKFTNDSTENKAEDLKKKQYKGEKLDFDKLKNKKNETENNQGTDIKNKLDGERNKEQDGVKFDKENDKNNIDDIKNETDNKEKLNNEREKEEDKEGVNLTDISDKNNSNKNENKEKINPEVDKKSSDENEKVVSLNDKRIEKGFKEVDEEKIKNDIRENLNGETIKDKKENKNDNSENNKQQKEADKIVNEKRKESKQRAEKLKKVLGVSKSQIRAKEVKLRKDLGSIKREKINIKNRKK